MRDVLRGGDGLGLHRAVVTVHGELQNRPYRVIRPCRDPHASIVGRSGIENDPARRPPGITTENGFARAADGPDPGGASSGAEQAYLQHPRGHGRARIRAGGGSGGSGDAYAAHVVPTGPPPAPPGADGQTHTIGYDRYSLIVDGKRLVLWSGEMHPSGCRARPCGATSCRRCAPSATTRSASTSPGTTTPRAGPLRLHRRPRSRPVPAHGHRDRSLRHPAPRPVHQRGDRRGRLPGLARRHEGHGPHLGPDVPLARRRVADPGRLDRLQAPVHPGHGHGPALPDRERVRRPRHRARRPRLHVPPVQEGARRRHRRPPVPQRQGPQRLLDPGVLRHRRGHGRLAVRLRRVSDAFPTPARLGSLRGRRGQGRGHRQPQDPWVRARVRRGLVRPVGRVLVRREGVRGVAPDA